MSIFNSIVSILMMISIMANIVLLTTAIINLIWYSEKSSDRCMTLFHVSIGVSCVTILLKIMQTAIIEYGGV